MYRFTALLIASALIAPQAFAQVAPKVDEKKLREALEDHLKDSESARFRGFRQSKPENGVWTLCGEVNAKNSYGAYSGFEPFLVIAGKEGKAPIAYVAIGVGESSGQLCAEKQLR